MQKKLPETLIINLLSHLLPSAFEEASFIHYALEYSLGSVLDWLLESKYAVGLLYKQDFQGHTLCIKWPKRVWEFYIGAC